MQILLIEADAQLRQQLALVLESGGGYGVTPVASAQQAVPLLLSQPFDLAIGRAVCQDQLPVQLARIGFGPAPEEFPRHCLGWVDSVTPLPGFAEQVRQLWHRHLHQHQ